MISKVSKVRSMEMAGWMMARMAAPLVPTKVAMCRPGCSCSEEILLSREVRVATRSAENIATAAWWNLNSGSFNLRGEVRVRMDGQRRMMDRAHRTGIYDLLTATADHCQSQFLFF